jgi:N utilization substance protein A
VTFAQKALSPAKVTRVQIIDPETKHLEIIVEDTQLSLAIGRKGQNVRLASKLIGWNVDIKSEEEKRQEIEAQMAALTAPGTPLSELQGIGPKTIERIEAHGVSLIEKLADMTPEQLMEIQGIGEKMVEKIQLAVAAYFQDLEARQAAAAEAAPEGEAEVGVEIQEAGPEATDAIEETEAPIEPQDFANETETVVETETETDPATHDATDAPEATETSEPAAEENSDENNSAGAPDAGEGEGNR